jgi:hypothetical protein
VAGEKTVGLNKGATMAAARLVSKEAALHAMDFSADGAFGGQLLNTKIKSNS